MSLLRQLRRGLRVLTHGAAADQDVADEVGHYLEEATAANVANGMSRVEARRAARRELGPEAAVREQVRSYGWETGVETLFQDLRFAARGIRRAPGFAVICAGTLALGIGASTAIFSAVDPILFQPLPYPHAASLVMISEALSDGRPLDLTFGSFREIAARSRSFDALAVTKPWQPASTGAGVPERLEGQRVSSDFFQVLGVAPGLGRGFLPAEDQVRGPNVAILSDRLWRRRFGGDPGIIGRPVSLNDDPYTVVGVMPRGFENVLSPRADVWAPLQYDAALPRDGREWGHHLRMVGRLRPGVPVDQAASELAAVAATPIDAFPRVPWASLGAGLEVTRLQDDVTAGVRPALLAVLGAVGLLLILACVNVTNLLLARAARRRGEFAMRTALGAGRIRQIRQLLTESGLLAGIGGALGVALAAACVRALVALSPPGLPRVDAIRVNQGALAFGLLVTFLTGLAVGLAPAIAVWRADLRAGMHDGSRGTVPARGLGRRALVVAGVALALVLLVGAGLLSRSLDRLFAVAPGFDPSRLLTMEVLAPGRRYDDPTALQQFYRLALDAVRQTPGVTAAGFTSQLPLSGDLDKYGIEFQSAPTDNPEGDGSVFLYAVSPGYLAAMGIPLKQGRGLTPANREATPGVALINESFARRFPGGDPLGQRVQIPPGRGRWYTVVGVVGDVRQVSLAQGVGDAVYLPTVQWPFPDRGLSLVVRTAGDPGDATRAVREAVRSVDPAQPIARVATMATLIATSAAERRFARTLFQAFALAALVLAAAGIYGVVSGSVAERVREIGVRAALGASRADILGMVVGQGLSLAGLGVAAGLVGAVSASGALVTLLFGVTRLDPVTYLGVIALVAAVAAVASAVPAWRAARIDPSITLKGD